MNPEALVAGQLRQVRHLLRHCLDHVAYYREVFAGLQPDQVTTLDDFRRLPILERRVYQERFRDFPARQLPPGICYAGESSTSGTSGVPVVVHQSNLTRLWWFALTLRELEWCGFDMRGTLAVMRGPRGDLSEEQLAQLWEGLTFSHWLPIFAGLLESGPSHMIELRQDPSRQLDWLQRTAPNYLLGIPSHLDLLATMVRESGQTFPRLRAILTISESLSIEQRRRIETGFGVPVHANYSSSEAGYLASPCPAGTGWHVHAENVLLEVLDPTGRPCAPGETGSVVLTTLHNFLTPLVRYQILDDATVGAPCSCGRGLPLLTHIAGKRRPRLRLPDGSNKLATYLVDNLGDIAAIRQFQIVQRASDHILLRVVSGPAWNATDEESVQRLFRDYLGPTIRVELELRARLEMPPSGKLVDVVSELSGVENESVCGPTRSAAVASLPQVVAAPSRAEVARLADPRGFPGNAWPPLPVVGLAPIWATYQELERTQWLSLDEIQAGQLRQVRTLLRHCIEHVAYYRGVLAGLNVEDISTLDDFRRLPILTRQTCRQRLADLEAQMLPPGLTAAGSGASTDPTGPPSILYTNQTAMWWLSLYLRNLAWGGFEPSATLAVFRPLSSGGPLPAGPAHGLRFQSWLDPLHDLLCMGPAHVLDTRWDPSHQWQWLQQVQPDYLAGPVATLTRLADVAARHRGSLLRLRAVQACNPGLDAVTHDRLQAAFSVPVHAIYDVAEVGFMAATCRPGAELHVQSESLLLEILDDAGKTCPPGQEGRVVVTHLHNFRMPFLRYDSGDRASWSAASCPCGRHLPLLTGVRRRG